MDNTSRNRKTDWIFRRKKLHKSLHREDILKVDQKESNFPFCTRTILMDDFGTNEL